MKCPFIDYTPGIYEVVDLGKIDWIGFSYRVIRIHRSKYLVLGEGAVEAIVDEALPGARPVGRGCESIHYRAGEKLLTIRRLVPEGVFEEPLLRVLGRMGISPKPLGSYMVETEEYGGFEVAVLTEYLSGERLDMVIDRLVSSEEWREVYREMGRALDTLIEADSVLIEMGRDRVVSPDELGADWRDRLLVRAYQLGGLGIKGVPQLLRDLYDALRRKGLPTAMKHYGYVHGDVHLGQYIRLGEQLLLTDYMGEPYREPIPRRSVEEILRDVASLLNSFEYILWRHRSRGIGDAYEVIDKLVESAYASLYHGLDKHLYLANLLFWRVERAAYETLYEELLGTGLSWIPLRIIADKGGELLEHL